MLLARTNEIYRIGETLYVLNKQGSALVKAAEVKQCGRGWTGTKPPGCTRAEKKSNAARPNAQTGTEEQPKQSAVPQKKPRAKKQSKPVEEVAKPAATEPLKLGFETVEGLDAMKTDWKKSISIAKKYAATSYDRNELAKIKQAIDYYKKQPPNQKSLWRGSQQKNSLIVQSLLGDQSYKEKQLADYFKKHKLDPNANIGRITDSLSVIDWIKESKRLKRKKTGGIKIDGKLAAAYVYQVQPDTLYIDFLAADPGDIIAGKSRGAGTAVLKALIQKSIEAGKGGKLTLEAMSGATGFYRSRGFELKAGSGNVYELSPENAKKLLEGTKNG